MTLSQHVLSLPQRKKITASFFMEISYVGSNKMLDDKLYMYTFFKVSIIIIIFELFQELAYISIANEHSNMY